MLLVTLAVGTALLVVVEGYDGAWCWLPLLRCVEARASVFSFLFFFYSTSYCCCWWRWRGGTTVALLGLRWSVVVLLLLLLPPLFFSTFFFFSSTVFLFFFSFGLQLLPSSVFFSFRSFSPLLVLPLSFMLPVCLFSASVLEAEKGGENR